MFWLNSQKIIFLVTRLLILSWQKIVCIRDYTRDLVLDQGISNVIYPTYPRNFRIICFVKYIRVAWPTPCRANTTELWKPCWTSLNADIWELLAIKCFCLNIHSEQDERSIHMCACTVPQLASSYDVFDTKLPNFYRLWKIESGRVTSMSDGGSQTNLSQLP